MRAISKYQSIDQFSISPQLYIDGKEEKSSLLGIILSLIYYLICLGMSIYFFYGMFSRADYSVISSTEYSTKYLSFNLTNKYAYFAFGVENPTTYDYYIDDTIFYPKAFFKQGVRNEKTGIFEWTEKQIDIEPCKLRNFGENYQILFENKPLNTMYCITNVTETLEGHFSYDRYSFFMVQLFECKNSTKNNNKCKPKNIIEQKLNGTFISVLFQSISVDPKNYEFPFQPVVENFYTTFGKNFHKEIHIFIKIIEVFTDQNFIFTSYNNISALQADSFQDMSTGEIKDSLCDITIKLSNKYDVIKRSYTKIHQVLGNLGGFIKVTSTIICMISLSPIQIIFENDIINRLYRFNFSDKQKKPRRSNNYFFDISQCDSSKKDLFNNYISRKVSFGSYLSTNKTFNQIPKLTINNEKDKIIFKNHSRLKLKKKDILLMNLCPTRFNKKKNVFLFRLGAKLYKQKMDIISLFKLFVNFEIIKLILFTKDQNNVLNYNHKPILYYNNQDINKKK